MADRIEKYSDKQVEEFSKKIRKIYTEAARDVKNKIKVFNERHEAVSKKMLQDVKDGKITEEDYKKWMKGQVFQGEQWKRKLEDITKVYVNADEKAREILDGTQKNVFMQAANYTAYDIEKGTKGAVAFNIYDKKTVERLLKDNPKTLPEWKIDEPKDYTWNEKRVQNEVSKGIIQGESIDEIGTRLTGQLASSNANKMVMFARTAVTGAQNAGRVERMQESKSMGIRVQKRWVATHDDRTRDAHLELDGQVVDVDEPFVTSDGMEIMFPGDPNADLSLVYNCRCTLGYEYPANLDELIEDQTGEETIDTPIESMTETREETDEETTKREEGYAVVEGKDISTTWQRRSSQFAFEIEDVIDAQGFNGKPRVVDADEFDELVKQANGGKGFIAQRTYAAPNQETLDAYREMLYDGKWYVDCSTGGAQYGQGMYCAADYTGTLSDGIREEMAHYQSLGESRNANKTINDISPDQQKSWIDEAIRSNFGEAALNDKNLRTVIEGEVLPRSHTFNALLDAHIAIGEDKYDYMKAVVELRTRKTEVYSYVETLTLDPSAKVITYQELDQMRTYSGLETKMVETLDVSRDTKSELLKWIDQEGDILDLPVDLRKTGELLEKKADDLMQMDYGSLATVLGYDAINAEGHGKSGSYTVILNRTKCVLRRGG